MVISQLRHTGSIPHSCRPACAEMVEDDDEDVRYQVLHTLCDGSPRHLEERVMDAVYTLNRDTNKKTKRAAHKVMASYRKNGKWNIM